VRFVFKTRAKQGNELFNKLYASALELIIEEAKTAERDARKVSAWIAELDQRVQQEDIVDAGREKSYLCEEFFSPSSWQP